MNATPLALHLINGLASAASLFLLASGLSLIFGVTRVLNFAHGSFFMLGLYVAYSLSEALTPVLGGLGFWLAVPLSALVTAALGALMHRWVLQPLQGRNELLQLLATFAVLLVIQDAALWVWGAEDLLGMRAPGLEGALNLWGHRVPTYDVFLLLLAPCCWWALHRLVQGSTWGRLVRAATQDPAMTAAVGVRADRLFLSVMALGCALAGLGGALQLPREPASLALDLQRIGDAFAVVIVGGMGSIHGAAWAALLITAVQSLCVALGTSHIGGVEVVWSQWTQAFTFALMAAVLVWRPWGLMGRPLGEVRTAASPAAIRAGPSRFGASHLWALGLWLLVALPWLQPHGSYFWILGIDVAIAMLYATGLRLLVGPAGLHSFGHAAYFGLGAYAAALLHLHAGWGLLPGLLGGAAVGMAAAWVLGALCVNHLGVYLAMLTLSMAQVMWAIAQQWEGVTGGSNGITGVWTQAPWDQPWALLALGLGLNLVVTWGLHRMLQSPTGWALQASQQSPQRALALGIPVSGLRWASFVVAGGLAGASGALFVFAKGSVSPQALSVAQSVDGLLMVMLGGWHQALGALMGAVAWVGLHDALLRSVEHWRAAMGVLLWLLVLRLPEGLAGLWPRPAPQLTRPSGGAA